MAAILLVTEQKKNKTKNILFQNASSAAPVRNSNCLLQKVGLSQLQVRPKKFWPELFSATDCVCECKPTNRHPLKRKRRDSVTVLLLAANKSLAHWFPIFNGHQDRPNVFAPIGCFPQTDVQIIHPQSSHDRLIKRLGLLVAKKCFKRSHQQPQIHPRAPCEELCILKLR